METNVGDKRRMTKAQVGMAAVAVLAVLVMCATGAIGSVDARIAPCPDCGGGSGPLAMALLASSGSSGVSTTAACAGNPANECISSLATSYTAPLMGPGAAFYPTDFSNLASGGNGEYSYYWAFPGGSGWQSGSEATSYEFTKIGSYTVSAEAADSGYGSLSASLSVSIVLGSPSSGASVSYGDGLLGFHAQLNEVMTQWVEKGLNDGGTAAAVVAAILAFAGPPGAIAAGIAALLAAVMVAYAAWMSGVDQGSGVCLYDTWLLTTPLVAASCPSGF